MTPGTAVALLLLSVATSAPEPGHPAASDPASSDIEEVRLDVNGRTVVALCTPGPRQVVLLHGENGSAEAWRPVLDLLDGQVGACAYDRPGTGRSDAAPSPRGWFELADDLAAIHRALGLEERYVLVGASLGGLYARLYAGARRAGPGGLVLVDPAHEDMPGTVRQGMPPEEWEAWAERRSSPNADGVRETDLAPRARRTTLPVIPITVITAAVREDGPGWNPRWIAEAARELHGAIVARQRLGRHVPAPGSGHDVHRDDPRLVADEILRVVGLVRARGGR